VFIITISLSARKPVSDKVCDDCKPWLMCDSFSCVIGASNPPSRGSFFFHFISCAQSLQRVLATLQGFTVVKNKVMSYILEVRLLFRNNITQLSRPPQDFGVYGFCNKNTISPLLPGYDKLWIIWSFLHEFAVKYENSTRRHYNGHCLGTYTSGRLLITWVRF